HLLRPSFSRRRSGPRVERRRDRVQPLGDRRWPQRTSVEARTARPRRGERIFCRWDQPRRNRGALEDRRVLRLELLLRSARTDHRAGVARQRRSADRRSGSGQDCRSPQDLAVFPGPPSRHVRIAGEGMTKEEIILANKEFLFPSVFHYYKEPLVVARAKNQYVWDAD